jgi:hypothetical protein
LAYTVTPIVIDIEALRRRIAERDLSLLEGIEADAEELDEDLDDDGPSTLEHARRIVLGQAVEEGDNAKYGYALRLICDAHGAVQPNDDWSSMRSSWFDAVDEALKAAGCPVALTTTLFYKGTPVNLPRPDDFPAVGYVEREQAGSLSAHLRNALPALSSKPRAAVEQVIGWLEAAHSTGLVTFYS